MVSLSTVRVDVYGVLRTLINANKLSGVTVVNSFPEASPAFPCIVMPLPDIGFEGAQSINGSLRIYNGEMEITFWAKADANTQGQAKVAAMMDNVQATLEANQSTLNTTDQLQLISLSPSAVEAVEVNGEKLYTAGLILSFEVTA